MMALSKDQLLGKLTELKVVHETIGHPLSPTCEEHSVNIKGTAFEKYIGNGQAKNLFFKVPSGGGPLKGRLFLVCALVETVVDNKLLSSRLGIKQSAPLRFADDEVFTDVLQIPKGSVNPFVMAQSSCDGVVLLLDKQFLKCEKLLFHPMQSDYTTALSPDELTSFLDKVAPSRYIYVDLLSTETISLPAVGGVTSSASKHKMAASSNSAVVSPKPAEVRAPDGFIDDRVAAELAKLGATIVVDPIGKLNAAGRLEGHSTHNFFVHCKKDKEKRMLVTVRQCSCVDMKGVAELVGSKEVRLCLESSTLLGSAKGCVTPLSLLYDEGRRVQWFVDDALLVDSSAILRLGTSEESAMPGTVVDISLAQLKKLLGRTGHWERKQVVSCSKWASSAAEAASSSCVTKDGDDTDFSRWYQQPYQTASGRIL